MHRPATPPSSTPSPPPSSVSIETGAEGDQDAPLLQIHTKLRLAGFRATCAACRNDLIALGSDTGTVLLLDAQSLTEVASFKSGTKQTCEVDFDGSGSFIVSSDGDGTVCVRAIVPHPQTKRIQLEEKHSAHFMNAGAWHLRVALDPMCYLHGDFAFACGGAEGRVFLTKKNWFFSSKTEELSSSLGRDGGITQLTWRGDLIAWISANGGLRIHDARLEVTVWRASREQAFDPSQPTDALVWENDESLLLAWGNRVGVIRIKQLDGNSAKKAGVLIWLENPCPLTYVAPFGGRHGRIILFGNDGEARLIERRQGILASALTYVTGDYASSRGSSSPLVIHDAFWSSPFQSNAPDANPSAATVNTQKKTVQQETGLPYIYVLNKIAGSDEMELAIIRSRTIDDSLHFALSHGDYERALAIARGAFSEKWCSLSETQVADAWLTNLFAHQQYDKIAEILPRILKSDDVTTWAKWSAVLAERRQLSRIVEMLPTGLPSAVYDAALSELLTFNTPASDARYTSLLRRLLGQVDAERAAAEVNQALQGNGAARVALKPALALAYSSFPHRTEDAFWAMLDSGWMDAFDVLERNASGHALLVKVLKTKRIADLCALNEDRCLALIYPFISSSSFSLADGTLSEEEQMTVFQFFPSIISQLRERGMELGALKLLRKWNSARRAEIAFPIMSGTGGQSTPALFNSTELFDLEVELCAKVDPPRLLELLRDTNGYSPDKALAICTESKKNFGVALMRETVFLLQRMGGPQHSKQALDLLVNEMDDLDAALEYAERENLFDELVKICITGSATDGSVNKKVLDLLGRAGGYSIDPARLVRALPPGLPGVRDRLLKLFTDLRATKSTRNAANRVFTEDASNVMKTVHRQFMRGVRVRASEDICLLCGSLLGTSRKDLVVFRTGHAYHHDCLSKSSAMLGMSSKSTILEDVSAASLVKQHCVIFGLQQNSSNDTN